MKYQIKLVLIGIITFIIVFLIPYGYHIDLGPGPDSIQAIIWEIYGIGNGHFLRFTPLTRIYFEYNFFRYISFFGVIFYYLFNFKKIYIILISIIGELIPLLFCIPAFFVLNEDGENLIPIILPILILLMFVLLIVFTSPNKFVKNSD
ncbi:MAG: hypothetical protein P8Y70_08835 [Candidatus Lokiarchaeota archaeon]